MPRVYPLKYRVRHCFVRQSCAADTTETPRIYVSGWAVATHTCGGGEVYYSDLRVASIS